jgi:acyl-CoA dehydrogenase
MDAATIAFEVGRSGEEVPYIDSMLVAGWLDVAARWTWSGALETVAVDLSSSLSCTDTADGVVLSGVLHGVPWAREAAHLVVVRDTLAGSVLHRLAREDYAVVPAANLAGEARDDVVLEDTHVSELRTCETRITAGDVMARGALVRVVTMAGAATRVLDMTVKYAMEREQFGLPLSGFQAVQQMLAQLAGETLTAVICARSAVEAASAHSSGIEIMAAKVRVGTAATRIARLAHQVHGAIGTTLEHPLHRLTTRLWSWRREFGAERYWAAELGRQLEQSRGEDPMWSLVTAMPASDDDTART